MPVSTLPRPETDSAGKTPSKPMLILSSITAFSIWRLQTIIATQAGFYPVLDPTWNEPEPTLISFVEVYIAALCASTPVFWPVLESQIVKIFVKYEFNVSSESRYEYNEVEVTNTRSVPMQHVADPANRSMPDIVPKEIPRQQESSAPLSASTVSPTGSWGHQALDLPYERPYQKFSFQ